MADELALDAWLAPLLARLSPPQLRQLTRRIALELKRRTAERIRQQVDPEGNRYVPRKPQPAWRQKQGRVKRQAMFVKMGGGRHLKTASDTASAAVGFSGRVARIAKVHQLGLRDRVSRLGQDYDYPRRELIGFTDADREWITGMILDFIQD